LIYKLFRKGYGYSAIADLLNNKKAVSPAGKGWNPVAVGRILKNRVYTGDTVQGISERISFKSKKARMLPKEKWVITENTHEPIISRELFDETQLLISGKSKLHAPNKGRLYALRGLVYCGECNSLMYARSRNGNRVAYVCGNYFRNGKKKCTSHIVYENDILEYISSELASVFNDYCICRMLDNYRMELSEKGSQGEGSPENRLKQLEQQLSMKIKQQQTAYTDRLEGRISRELFERTNKILEEKISELKKEMEELRQVLSELKTGSGDNSSGDGAGYGAIKKMVDNALLHLKTGKVSNEALRTCFSRITVYENNDTENDGNLNYNGIVLIDFNSSNKGIFPVYSVLQNR